MMNPNHQPTRPEPGRPPASAAPVEDVRTQALSEALKSSFVVVKIALVILALYLCGSNFFTVPQNERAVILRFGKPVGEGDAMLLGPGGFHLAFPYPIDEVERIPSEQILSASSTAGWYAEDPRLGAMGTNQPMRPTLHPAVDGYTLTGDGNIIHLRATLRYRIEEPLKYHFGFTNAARLVTNALNNALFHVSARFTVDDALRLNLAGLHEKVAARLETLIHEQQLGIAVEQVEVVSAPPLQVKDAFDQVTTAENERGTKINSAQAYANKLLAKAEGEAKALLNAAETERTRLVESTQADASYFTELLPSYEENPVLFTRRLQIETLGRVLTNVQDKFFIPARADGLPREVRVQLNREPPRLKAPIELPKTEHTH